VRVKRLESERSEYTSQNTFGAGKKKGAAWKKVRRPGVVREKSEQEFQPKLKGTGAMRATGMQEIGIGEVVADSIPLRMVENIEGFRAELKARGLVEFEVFRKGHVEVSGTWDTQDVATGIAKG